MPFIEYGNLIELLEYFQLYKLGISLSNISVTLHPFGIPFIPLGHVVNSSLMNKPVSQTPFTQLDKQLFADISVARHLILFKLEQEWNIPR